MEENSVVLCLEMREEEWIERHEKVKDVSKHIGVKKAGQRVPGSGKVAWRKTVKSAKEEQERALDRRSALRGSLLSIWNVDIHQALRMCEDRQVEVEASEASYVSWDRVDRRQLFWNR